MHTGRRNHPAPPRAVHACPALGLYPGLGYRLGADRERHGNQCAGDCMTNLYPNEAMRFPLRIEVKDGAQAYVHTLAFGRGVILGLLSCVPDSIFNII